MRRSYRIFSSRAAGPDDVSTKEPSAALGKVTSEREQGKSKEVWTKSTFQSTHVAEAHRYERGTQNGIPMTSATEQQYVPLPSISSRERRPKSVVRRANNGDVYAQKAQSSEKESRARILTRDRNVSRNDLWRKIIKVHAASIFAHINKGEGSLGEIGGWCGDGKTEVGGKCRSWFVWVGGGAALGRQGSRRAGGWTG